ncbi:endo-1,3;1,4-beta-D-glucanase-like isoform X2 [Lycium ferocissimum]|uniref:endo-1,3;1,4-beta-D-glucanase-like isoform X2 n=1 Tax=Lycium ferocissimum TaxID=112874 RepID=UPI0028153E2E|nr:endo-1,3;1,4-beta-D-glucanase-like isoform X2 [Lycium ferocissimum]
MSGPECCENPPNLSASRGQRGGSVLEVGGFKTYVCGPSNSKHAILLVSDVFGYEAPNLRKLADKVAAEGYYVVVPDFLYGDPYSPENTEKPLSIWIQSHGTDKGFEDAKQVVAALKDKGISAIGAAGFCWGAKVVTDLAKSDYIQAAALLHPSLVKVDDFKGMSAPIAILAAEIDKISPPELIKQFEEILSSRSEVDSFVKIFPSVKHGWTVRYNVEDKEAVLRAEEAHCDMLDWLTKHVK